MMRAQSYGPDALGSETRFPFPPLDGTLLDDSLPTAKDDEENYVKATAMDSVDGLTLTDDRNLSLITPGPTSGHLGGIFKHDELLRLKTDDDDWWTLCQLPVFVVLFAVIGVLTVTFVVLLWLKSQMLESEKDTPAVKGGEPVQKMLCPCATHGPANDDRWIYHSVINLKSASDEKPAVPIQPKESSPEPVPVASEPDSPPVVAQVPAPTEKRSEVGRVRARGLLERRGSNVSLTIDLPHSNNGTPAHVITPTRECSAEEYLLSAGNTMCRAQLRSCLRETSCLHREFWDIPLNHPEETEILGSVGKNRYRSILPNERSRVRLDNSEESYINANYIRGYDGEEKVYIATQGPLGNTVADLYLMIWEHNSPIIVMMTHLVEKSRTKCEAYFPTAVGESCTFSDFDVTCEEVCERQGFVVRNLNIEHMGEKRRVVHYWYDTWPDHKTPQSTQAILAMATEVERLRTSLKNTKSSNNNEYAAEEVGPIVVHCSAGIGRTGCFIAISLAICQLLEEDKVDLLGIVCQMRYDRGGMIQTAEQYEFVHRAISVFEASLPDATASRSSE